MITHLNLLPPEYKKEVQRTKFLLLVHEILLFLFIAIAASSGILLVAHLTLEQKFQEAVRESAPGTAKITRLDQNIKDINKRLAVLGEVPLDSTPWSDIILDILARTPPQINYKSLGILDDGTIKLSGTAGSRSHLVNFEKELKISPYISDVDLPLQYLVKEQDIEFRLEITLDINKIKIL